MDIHNKVLQDGDIVKYSDKGMFFTTFVIFKDDNWICQDNKFNLNNLHEEGEIVGSIH